MVKPKTCQAGFTLLEVMAVVVILGILATTATVIYINHVANARVSEARLQIGEYKKAVESYRLDHGNRLPDSMEQLTQADKYNDQVRGPYLEKIARDPWGNDYIYLKTGNAYEIRSLGADGREGGENLDKDISSRD